MLCETDHRPQKLEGNSISFSAFCRTSVLGSVAKPWESLLKLALSVTSAMSMVGHFGDRRFRKGRGAPLEDSVPGTWARNLSSESSCSALAQLANTSNFGQPSN